MTAEIKTIDAVKNSLTKMSAEFKKVLPEAVSVEKFTRVVFTALQTAPALLEQDRASLFAACLNAAQSGLMPDGAESALVPYKGKVKFLPMIKGVIKKIRANTFYKNIIVEIVYGGDDFRYWVDELGQHIQHDPDMFGERGAVVGAYAMVRAEDGSIEIEIMSEEELMAVKNASPSKDGGPWSGPFANEMRKKTVLRRLSKRLALDPGSEAAIHMDDDLFIAATDDKKEEKKPSTAPERLTKIIKGGKATDAVSVATSTLPSLDEKF